MFSDKVCRRARINRDSRFDGLFYSAATTTKVYCRPICPGTPPLEGNATYFSSSAAARAAGYRPCLRCRPELAPGNWMRNAVDWRVRHVLERIHQGAPAAALTAAERTSGAAFRNVVGASVTQYQLAHRLDCAKMLLSDTALELSRVATATGFSSPRQLQKAVTRLYGRDIFASRKPLPQGQRDGLPAYTLMLHYRPPFDWGGCLEYFRKRAIAGVEWADGETYRRSFQIDGHPGWFSLQHVPDRRALRLEVHTDALSGLMQIVMRIRRMFDLDADPLMLDAFFRNDRLLGKLWKKHRGLRVPVGWDAFEFSVRAVVGQLISVRAATVLMGKIAGAFSEETTLQAPREIGRVFPGPSRLQDADLQSCGLTQNKAAAIRAIARATLQGTLVLGSTADLKPYLQQCTALRGIGDWTAQTIAMRGMGHPDAFPAGDLGIVKALSTEGRRLKPAEVHKTAERWWPWRAYAAMLLWRK